MNGAGHAVLKLQVHLRDGVFGKDGGIRNVTYYTLFSFCSCKIQPKSGVVRMAADSTMLRMVNLLIALSLGVHREQLEHRIGLTWPRPFLLRPLQIGQSCDMRIFDNVSVLGSSLLHHFDCLYWVAGGVRRIPIRLTMVEFVSVVRRPDIAKTAAAGPHVMSKSSDFRNPCIMHKTLRLGMRTTTLALLPQLYTR